MNEVKMPRSLFPIGVHCQDPDWLPEHVKFETMNWNATDEEKKYQRVLRELDKWGKLDEWKWTNKKIDYKINKNGLRHNELITEDYDFSDKYVVLGCSFVEGIGCLENETIAGWLTKLSGVKTINFGNGGTGCDVAGYNALWLGGLKNPPKKIFIVWPAIQRFSMFNIMYDYVHKVFRPNDNAKAIVTFLGHSDPVVYNHWWTPRYALEPRNQQAHKFLLKQLINNLWGDNAIELEIIDTTKYNPFYREDLKHELVGGGDRRFKKGPMGVMNDYLARDINKDVVKFLLTPRPRDMLVENHPGYAAHWGSQVHKNIAEWFLAQ